MKSLAGWASAVFLTGVMLGQWIGDTRARYTAAKSGGLYYGRVAYDCARKQKTYLPNLDMSGQNHAMRPVPTSPMAQ